MKASLLLMSFLCASYLHAFLVDFCLPVYWEKEEIEEEEESTKTEIRKEGVVTSSKIGESREYVE